MPRQSQPTTQIETDDPTPKRVSTGVQAGRLYERIQRLNAEEDAEIRRAPESIRERYAERRRKILAAATPEVARLAAQMLQGGGEK